MSDVENILILLKRASVQKGITMAGFVLEAAIEEAKQISIREGYRAIEISDVDSLNGEEIEAIIETILEEQAGE